MNDAYDMCYKYLNFGTKALEYINEKITLSIY